MDTTLQTISFFTIFLSLATVSVAIAIAVRRSNERDVFPVRIINAYEVLPDMIGQSIEADRPILVSSGSTSIGDDTTLLTLAGLQVAYHVTSETAVGQSAPIFVTSETAIVPLGYDVLRRAYEERDMRSRHQFDSVRWYPADQRSLVFAAMLTTALHSDEVVGNVLVGRFGRELALVLASSMRKSVPSVAGSLDLEGQAVAYAMSDGALIGEDIYSPSGYLTDSAPRRAVLVAQDILRMLLIIFILAVAASEIAVNVLGTAQGN